jgi:hypothetical protein
VRSVLSTDVYKVHDHVVLGIPMRGLHCSLGTKCTAIDWDSALLLLMLLLRLDSGFAFLTLGPTLTFSFRFFESMDWTAELLIEEEAFSVSSSTLPPQDTPFVQILLGLFVSIHTFESTMEEQTAPDDTLAGEVNTQFAERRVWLVKVPNFLFDAWTKAGNNVELGTVTIEEVGGVSEVR